jgi:hypothetical protein
MSDGYTQIVEGKGGVEHSEETGAEDRIRLRLWRTNKYLFVRHELGVDLGFLLLQLCPGVY